MFRALTRPLANRFRQTVSGSVDGTPPWAAAMLEGDDEGFFGPESAVWEVHGSLSTLVGGIRALLLQASHPAALTGVTDHSRYEEDPLGRLAGTTRWLTVTTFGSREVATREAGRVNALHKKVVGEYADRSGAARPYAARDPRFLLWVHSAFTDSFLKAHLSLGYPLRRGADRYVAEWSQSAVPLGLATAPMSVAELEATLQEYRTHELATIDATRRIVHFILNPPFNRAGLAFYRVLANAAIASLDDRDRERLGLPKRSRAWLRLARLGLGILSVIVGKESPSQQLARQRIARVRAGGEGR